MDFDKGRKAENLGKSIGLIVFYLIFTTVVYFIFKLTGKLPSNYTYFHIIPFTLMILLIGVLLKQYFKI